MRFKEVIYKGEKVYNSSKIISILENENFYWLIESEIENAEIEIKNNTLIWNNGSFYAGNWYYGIFKNGDFHGRWENGIFEGGNFKGKFLSGIKI